MPGASILSHSSTLHCRQVTLAAQIHIQTQVWKLGVAHHDIGRLGHQPDVGVSPLSCCVTSGRFLALSGLQVPHPQNENNKSNCCRANGRNSWVRDSRHCSPIDKHTSLFQEAASKERLLGRRLASQSAGLESGGRERQEYPDRGEAGGPRPSPDLSGAQGQPLSVWPCTQRNKRQDVKSREVLRGQGAKTAALLWTECLCLPQIHRGVLAPSRMVELLGLRRARQGHEGGALALVLSCELRETRAFSPRVLSTGHQGALARIRTNWRLDLRLSRTVGSLTVSPGLQQADRSREGARASALPSSSAPAS
ncbi:uncharacterized protein LOC124968732 [Sciurus carolinensis]|uniref:uncharacterized protein LOC124968732 n=1 Tax=Sciurus carolinensis TaxID=30640 RepID=UPI001FB3E40C|nr:uncharacterized protein LOC124968732 [Sciurus carolinensis]XP_047387422.1 uncharacterized protein LOC124968732 [Sciurus carolinensis]XP_047387423.1 uncharacterized protein LOC124968732 [Sciurus carolinensis]